MTRTGEIAEVNSIGEGDPVWPAVTSTVENCLGSECPSYQDCHVFKARRKAQKADLVIVNHHLFFSDLTLKQEGFGELLPQADACILDEAHQLPELASDFLATTTTSRQLKNLAEDVIAAQLEEAPESGEIPAACQCRAEGQRGFSAGLGRAQGANPVARSGGIRRDSGTGLISCAGHWMRLCTQSCRY